MSFLKSPLFKFDILLHFPHFKFDEPSLEDFSQTTPKKQQPTSCLTQQKTLKLKVNQNHNSPSEGD